MLLCKVEGTLVATQNTTIAGSDPVIIVCTKEQHTKPVTFTSHPVEQGSPVTDHARPEPLAWRCLLLP